jgi:hypothetical protein
LFSPYLDLAPFLQLPYAVGMTTLATIKEKVHAGERLSEADALALYASNDLLPSVSWLPG